MRQGVPVGDISMLEGIGTRIEAAGLKIAKGDICLRWGRQKERILGVLGDVELVSMISAISP